MTVEIITEADVEESIARGERSFRLDEREHHYEEPVRLQESHAPSGFYGKVSKLHPGEVVRLNGGMAVKKAMTEDGREVFRLGHPTRFGSTPGKPSWGSLHATAEDGVKAAFKASAESTEPGSIGGRHRLAAWEPLTHKGKGVRIREWTAGGQVVVSPLATPSLIRTIDPAELLPAVTPADVALGETADEGDWWAAEEADAQVVVEERRASARFAHGMRCLGLDADALRSELREDATDRPPRGSVAEPGLLRDFLPDIAEQIASRR